MFYSSYTIVIYQDFWPDDFHVNQRICWLDPSIISTHSRHLQFHSMQKTFTSLMKVHLHGWWGRPGWRVVHVMVILEIQKPLNWRPDKCSHLYLTLLEYLSKTTLLEYFDLLDSGRSHFLGFAHIHSHRKFNEGNGV